jgi:Uma2 family endonuclease
MLTPDALLALPELEDGGHYELSDGELIVAKPEGASHALLKIKLFEILLQYGLRTDLGRTFCESEFTLGTQRARVPDVAWVSTERFSLIPHNDHVIPIAPDIAMEIVSESEQLSKAEKKLRDYLEAGVEVWQIFPATQTVVIWRGKLGVRLTGEELITSERLPGFSVALADVFH